MIKMIVTDLDETLLRTDKTISQYTIDTLKKARDQGIKVVFATARGGSTKSLVPYELFDGYVLMNGAKAYIENNEIYNKLIPAEIYRPFLINLSKKDVKVAAEVSGMHYANFQVSERWSYIRNYEITDFEETLDDADKLYAIIEKQDQVELINSMIPNDLYLNVSRDHLAMIMHKEATKIHGIREIAHAFDITVDEIVAFGDDVNDTDMLVHAGISVAMGNAIDAIKSLTDHVCDTNDNDGVAKWLDRHILQKEYF